MAKKHTDLKYDGESGFQFKYIAEEELLCIVKKVERERRREKEAIAWEEHVRQKNSTGNLQKNDKAIPIYAIQAHADQNALDKTNVSKTANDRLSCSQGITATSCDRAYLQRIAIFRNRISVALDKLANLIRCDPSEPDGPEDLERRKIRASEFLSRFSRNYLFQLRMQVSELHRLISTATFESSCQNQAFLQKLIGAHQTALQGLQAYINQFPSSLRMVNILVKLKELLLYLYDLNQLKDHLDSQLLMIDEGICEKKSDEINEKCAELLSELEEKKNELEICGSARCSSLQSARTIERAAHPSLLRARPPLRRGRSCSSAPLGPRSLLTANSTWKKSATLLARSKFGPPPPSVSSPRLSSREHHSQEDGAILYRRKPSKCQDSSCPVKTHSREADSEEEEGSTESLHKLSTTEIKKMLLQMHRMICNKKKKCGHQEYRSAKHGRSISREKQSLTKVQNISSNIQLVLTKHLETYCSVATNTEPFDLKHNDVSTSTEKEDELKKNKKVGWTQDDVIHTHSDVIEKVNSTTIPTTQTTGQFGSKDSKPGIKEQRILGYRDRFSAYKNCVESSDVQRWCENILDSVFLEVARELEPSILLEKMYHLEFEDQ